MANISKIKLPGDTEARNIKDKRVGYVELSSTSGKLTDAQYAEVLKDICFIKRDTSWYIKTYYPSTTVIYFTRFKINNYTNYYKLGEEALAINTSDKKYSYITSNVIQMYSSSQTDTLLSGKVDKSQIGIIELSSTSGTLDDAQYAEALKDICVIDQTTNEGYHYYYIKYKETPATIDFNYFTKGSTGGHTAILRKYCQISKTDKSYTVHNDNLELYSASETDALLQDKQGTLTAGDGIDITNNVVSMEDPVSVMTQQEFDNATTGTTPSGVNPIVDLIYPIGAIYMSVNSTNPSTLFGGTWEQLKDRFLLGAGDTYTAGVTGGNATHSHTLGNGYAKIIEASTSGYAYFKRKNTEAWLPNQDCENNPDRYNSFDQWTISAGTELGGSTDSSNSMPPYLVVYMWKRTA